MKTGPIGRDAGDHLGVFVRIGADNALDHEGFPACLHVVRDAAGPKSGKEGFSLRPGIRERRGGLHLTQQPFQRPAAHDNFRVRRSEIPDVGGNFPQWAAVMSGRFNLNGLSGVEMSTTEEMYSARVLVPRAGPAQESKMLLLDETNR